MYWLAYFHQKLDKDLGNQHLQFTAEIWMSDTNLTPSTKKYNIRIVTDNKLPLLDMKVRHSPEGDL